MQLPLCFIKTKYDGMIYINDLSGTITVPKHNTSEYSETYTIVLSSNLSNEVKIVEDGSNISTNTLYYQFALSGLTLNVGEYTYTLYNDTNDVLEVGLLTYGEFNREVIVNNTTVKEKIQYNPDAEESSNAIKNNTYYYGFGTSVEDMLSNAGTKAASNAQQFSFTSTSTKDDSKFYLVYDANIIWNQPTEFTCGGAPMVMLKQRLTINNKACEVWVSGETYNANTTLTVISTNI